MENKKSILPKIYFIISVCIFGVIGVIRKNINLNSSVVAMFRGLVGGGVLFIVAIITKTKVKKDVLKKNILLLALSGVLIAFDWVLFFEAYNYTTVATTTLCYYMAPVFIIIVSPFVFKEKLSIKKIICIIIAFAGVILVSGLLKEGFSGGREFTGVLLALLAAVIYAMIVILNKKILGVPALLKTAIEILVTGIVLIPYNLITEDLSSIVFDGKTIFWLAICCLIATGFAYFLYFGSLEKLNAQTVSILSYLDPFIAVLSSVFILGEELSIYTIIGCILILGSTIVSELNIPFKRKLKE